LTLAALAGASSIVVSCMSFSRSCHIYTVSARGSQAS